MHVDETRERARPGLRERLLAGAGLSIERLPLLRAVFADMASGVEKSLQGVSEAAIKFFVVEIGAERASDLIERFERSASTALYEGAEQDAKIFVGADREFVFTLVETLFGADGSEPAYDERRDLSNVEIRIGQFACGGLAKALQESFSAIADIPFAMEPAQGKLDPAVVKRRNASSMICRCRLEALGCGGELFVAIPHALLEPHRDTLSRDPKAETPLLDPEWAKRMQDRVAQTEVSVHAVLEKPGLTLADIARLEVGQIVELPISPTSLIKLECEGQALFWCELGQKDGLYSIRIEDLVDQEQEFIDDMLGG